MLENNEANNKKNNFTLLVFGISFISTILVSIIITTSVLIFKNQKKRI